MSKDFEDAHANEGIPMHVRCSVPEEMFDLVAEAHGSPEKAFDIFCAMNDKPPLTIRANTIKTTPRDLKRSLIKHGFSVRPCNYAQNGLTFLKQPKVNLF